jgi:hypothetical protein
MNGNRKMKKHNDGNSSADLFNKIKLEMFRKIHGLSEKEAKAERASRKLVSRDQAELKEDLISDKEFFWDIDIKL